MWDSFTVPTRMSFTLSCQRLEYLAVDVSRASEIDALNAVLVYCTIERTER